MNDRSTTFYLVRHAAHVLGEGVLIGRQPGVGLSELGRRQAREITRGAWAGEVRLVHSSPRQRAVETAAILAAELGLHVTMAGALDEVDFGRWTGCSLADLERDPDWRRWNSARHLARTPGGETMAGIARRALRHLHGLHCRHSGKSIAIVTHAEVIRALLMQVKAIPAGDWHRVGVPLASVTPMRWPPGEMRPLPAETAMPNRPDSNAMSAA